MVLLRIAHLTLHFNHLLISNHFCFLFFFSSRRRHTRSTRDWSSDVCSSDLSRPAGHSPPTSAAARRRSTSPGPSWRRSRSEERRVGKECRCGWWRVDEKKKKVVKTS